MKNFLFALFVVMVALNTNAQTPSKPMATYRDACVKLLSGIDNDFDTYYLGDALDLFKKIRITEFSEADYNAVDSTTISNETNPTILFVPEYADSLIRNHMLIDLENISIMRKGEDYDVQILHKGIKAGKTVCYQSAGQDFCELLVVGESKAKIKLTVTNLENKEQYVGVFERDGSIAYTQWMMSSVGGRFEFKIENETDKDVSIVIAVN